MDKPIGILGFKESEPFNSVPSGISPNDLNIAFPNVPAYDNSAASQTMFRLQAAEPLSTETLQTHYRSGGRSNLILHHHLSLRGGWDFSSYAENGG